MCVCMHILRGKKKDRSTEKDKQLGRQRHRNSVTCNCRTVLVDHSTPGTEWV